jgi:phage baseplate assembly protein gpV
VSLTLFESIQRIVQDELRQVRTAELAIVETQHPHAAASDTDNYACTVRLRDSQIVLAEVPVLTGRIGAAAIPGVGELVLVQFVAGDVNRPVITGRLYNNEDRPPENEDGKAVLHLPLGAADADAVHLELWSGDTRKAVVKLGTGLELTVQDDDPAVTLAVGGNATLEIAKDGAVSLESQGDVELKGASVTVEASGELTLKGSTVNIN